MKTLFMPVVETRRLMLRPIALTDASAMYDYCSDDETVRLLSFDRHENVAQTKQIIEHVFLTKPQRNLPQAYAIVLRDNNQMIGTCDFIGVINEDNAEIGYVLHKDYWNHGYMSEAVAKLIEVGFEVLGLRRVYARHHTQNIGSKRVIEKCGLIYEGTQREWKKNPDGTYSDLLCYSLLSHEYYARKKELEK